MQLIIKQQTGKKIIRLRDLQNMCSYCARTIATLMHVNSPGGSTSVRYKIKTLITHLCSHIISDSVAVEILTIGQPCTKIFRQV